MVSNPDADKCCSDLTKIIRTYLESEWNSRKKKTDGEWIDKDWHTIFPKQGIPQQRNSFDCGVFVCMFMDFYLAGEEPNFTQDNIPAARLAMLHYILEYFFPTNENWL